MKKVTTLFFLAFLFNTSHAQMEVGYNTTDVGAEFQWYKDGKFIGLHLATNAKLHHSFHATIGYYMAGDPTASFYYNQNSGGLGVGLGYRYYVDLRPHGFFIGAKADLFTYKVMLDTQTPEGPYTSMIFIPSVQTGYMILINDMFFITPTIGFCYKTNLQSKMSGDEKRSVLLFGISLGAKF
jgi:long-subunit fatty acid transport protein